VTLVPEEILTGILSNRRTRSTTNYGRQDQASGHAPAYPQTERGWRREPGSAQDQAGEVKGIVREKAQAEIVAEVKTNCACEDRYENQFTPDINERLHEIAKRYAYKDFLTRLLVHPGQVCVHEWAFPRERQDSPGS